ncbi:hypothetical protein A7O61_13340, partial [Listeria monocytogenes]
LYNCKCFKNLWHDLWQSHYKWLCINTRYSLRGHKIKHYKRWQYNVYSAFLFYEVQIKYKKF